MYWVTDRKFHFIFNRYYRRLLEKYGAQTHDSCCAQKGRDLLLVRWRSLVAGHFTLTFSNCLFSGCPIPLVMLATMLFFALPPTQEALRKIFYSQGNVSPFWGALWRVDLWNTRRGERTCLQSTEICLLHFEHLFPDDCSPATIISYVPLQHSTSSF